MSDLFAIIRQPEAEALKRLSSNAAKALIAIKFGQSDGSEIAFGVRDLDDWGMSRSVAGRALQELLDANIITVSAESSFGAKRKRRTWRVVNVRKNSALQSRQRDTVSADSPSTGTMEEIQSHRRDYGDGLQSHGRDTTRTPSFPPVRREGKEGGQEAQAAEAEPSAGVVALRKQQARIAVAAEAVAMTALGFMNKAGGPKAADFLARKFQRGELDALQLHAAFADPPNGLAMEPSALPASQPKTALGAR